MVREQAGYILAAFLIMLSAGRRCGAAEEPAVPPAEVLRLDTGQFLDGLERRGLRELIELYLRDFPPEGTVENQLLRRRLRLADFADQDLSQDKRRRAIAEANLILEHLIEENPRDDRRFTWMFTLPYSLLYDEGEPLFTSILYRNGTDAERAALGALTERAVAAVNDLAAALEAEYDRVDKLPIDQFAKLEGRGYIDEIDQLGPKAHYLRLWSLFYDCLPRNEQDPKRVQQLHEVREGMAANPSYWEAPHETSRIQIPALLLAGMVERRLHDHGSARRFFDRAIAVADRLTDSNLRGTVDWAVFLASIERIRNDADDGRFEAALEGVESLCKQLESTGQGEFGRSVVAALLERAVQRDRAAAADRDGRTSDAVRFRSQSWQPLLRLLNMYADRRDEIYATVYDLIEPEARPDQLDPVDQCALIAGALAVLDPSEAEAGPLLDRAVAAGESFLAATPPQARELRPEVLYNYAVVQYRRGLAVDAARRFLNLAREVPQNSNAFQSVIWSVQIASRLYQDPSWSVHPELGRLYHDALDYLVTHFPDTDDARYWRFYFAQLLEEQDDVDRAAGQYGLVVPGHEHYHESLFRRLRCTARGLMTRSEDARTDALAFRRLAEEFLSAQRSFAADATGTLAAGLDEDQQRALQQAAARSQLLAAEIQVLPLMGRQAQALEALKELERQFPEDPVFIGRVWRARLMGYEALGQFDEAASAIPAYVAADPVHAGPTLQSLYSGVMADFEKLRIHEDQRSAQRKAEIGLVLARQLVQWDDTHGNDPLQRRAFQLQLAESSLYAGHAERARELFEALDSGDGAASGTQEPADLRILAGLAESLFQLKQYESALERFNTLAIHLPVSKPIRWQALLRDLQCRTALGHEPDGIVKVILQQRHLHPQLGGPALAAQFDKLQRENQRRLDESRND